MQQILPWESNSHLTKNWFTMKKGQSDWFAKRPNFAVWTTKKQLRWTHVFHCTDLLSKKVGKFTSFV